MKKQWDVTVYIHGLLMTTVKPIRTLALIIETVVCFQNVVSWNCSQPWYMLQKFHGWNGWKCSGMPRSRYFKLVSHDLRMWAFDLHFSRYFKLVSHGLHMWVLISTSLDITSWSVMVYIHGLLISTSLDNS